MEFRRVSDDSGHKAFTIIRRLILVRVGAPYSADYSGVDQKNDTSIRNLPSPILNGHTVNVLFTSGLKSCQPEFPPVREFTQNLTAIMTT